MQTREDKIARVYLWLVGLKMAWEALNGGDGKVKQIGNSVPVRTAEAMMAADLESLAA